MLIDPNNDSLSYGKSFNWLLRIPVSELSHAAKICYIRLSQYYNINKKCFPSVDVLAEEVGLQKRQVIRELRKLENLKLIKIISRAGHSNSYVFLDNKYRKSYLPVDNYGYNLLALFIGGCQMCHGRGVTSDRGGVSDVTPIIYNIIKRLNKSTPKGVRVVDNFFSLDNCPAAFQKCMKIYPRTIHRTRTQTTFKLWKKAVQIHGEEKVYAGTASYARYCAGVKKEPQHVYGKKNFYDGHQNHFLTDWDAVLEQSKKYAPKSHFTFSPKAYNKTYEKVSPEQREKNKLAARKLKNTVTGE